MPTSTPYPFHKPRQSSPTRVALIFAALLLLAASCGAPPSISPVDLEQSYDPPDVGLALDITRYEYNLDKDLTRIIRPDGASVAYGYDAGGRLAGVTAPDSLIAYSYGSAGCSSCGGGDLPVSVTRTDSQGSQNIAYAYDGSLTKSVTWSGPVAGSLAVTYDNDFWVTSWSVNGGAAISQSYNADGQLTQAGNLTLTYNASSGFLTGASLGVVADAYQYTNYGETAAYAATAASQEIYHVSYTRDALGRIESENEVVEGVATQWAYRYDAAGRLVEVLKDGASWSVYRYDSNGNRIEAATQSGLVAGVYDAQDRLISYGQFSYTYTANGELNTKTDTATGQVTRYAYDVLGNLVRVDLPDSRVIEYVIDGANRRVGKKVNGVLVKGWLYKDSLKPIAELDGAGNVIATFVYGSKYNVPDYVVKGGVTYRIVSDHLGSPRLIVDSASGAIVARIDYDEFGNVLADSSPGFLPFGFAGGLYDSDTGLVRFGARDYDPIAGRWTSKDPIGFAGEDHNLFGYVLNDPINFIDAEGLFRIVLPPPRVMPRPLPRTQLPKPAPGPTPTPPAPPHLPPDEDCPDDDCEEETKACEDLCKRAKDDPDMINIWGGSWNKCMKGCLSERCGGNPALGIPPWGWPFEDNSA